MFQTLKCAGEQLILEQQMSSFDKKYFINS